jgi:DNA-binding GntR family transcriptional regulator
MGPQPSCRKTGELRLGRRVERFDAEEISDADKAPLLRAYLKKWAFEVKAFFEDVAADASDAELLRIAPNHPVFRIVPVSAAHARAEGAGQPTAGPDL